MKILFAHNDYGRYSGEEAVVDRMIADRKAEGHTVEVLRPTTEGYRGTMMGNIKGFFAGIYCRRGVIAMRSMLKEFKPDLVHIHNLYPFISPAALFECRKAHVPVIMTVHNYRLMCPTGLFLRDGKPCEECLRNGNEWACIRHNCEHSWLKTLGYSLRNTVARLSGAFLKNVDTFCCLTEFQRQKLIEAGYPAQKIQVIYNYIEESHSQQLLQSGDAIPERDSFVGFVGRLSQEKGYDLLVEVAERHPEIPFQFAGFIREEEHPKQLPNVTYRGTLNKSELNAFYRQAAFIALPSRFYEGFPIVLLEALSYGKPCVVPNQGCYPELVSYQGDPCGKLFKAMDVDSLEQAVVDLWNHREEQVQLSHNALSQYQARFSKEIISQQWNKLMNGISPKQ